MPTETQRAYAADRQRRFRERQSKQGIVQVAGLLPEEAAADFLAVCAFLRENPSFTFGPMRDTATGRLRSWRKAAGTSAPHAGRSSP